MGFWRKNGVAILVTLLLLISLPLLLVGFRYVTNYLSRAIVQEANIVVDVNAVEGPLPQNWRAIAQGGEEGYRTFLNVRDELQELAPRYVRIDHIYDSYNVVSRQNGQLVLDFSELDQTVRDIIASGAKPFFAISYMPLELTDDGTIIGKPRNWNEWQLLVQKTIEHYSGTYDKGFELENVYYEVWNEPDLFGQWKTYGEKNYLELYKYGAQGAQSAQGTKRFFFGGPATTAPYRNWMVNFLRFIQERNLRLDFISWHRYSEKPEQFAKDVGDVEGWIAGFPEYNRLPKVISEFGYDSENNPAHDSRVSAAHTVAVIRQIIPQVETAFSFELKDGPSSSGEKLWGRWGILTHDAFDNEKKPRYYALSLLNKLGGRRLRVAGEGTYVKAIATQDFGEIKIVLVNFDRADGYAEQVPVTITNLAGQQYSIIREDIQQNITTATVQAVNGKITREVIMPPNSVVLLTLSPFQ